ncbi:hypothetical protein AWB77_04707 [Caballeronia fortuita]|uniref:Uncharacterized protein n=1 Tax=Caballeronia fortuita TaxID=1777138 RepID=A0A158CYC8_9BURK|nr:hypothetical protein [Caballeronia fortuita]SAK87365.1 hypothetical protein AWB77_04707 [Caballeronia fortuita]
MANRDLLDRVYACIGTMRSRGDKLNVEKVAMTAGVARATLYLPDPDWREVRAVIKGKTSSRVKLVEIELAGASKVQRKVAELKERVANAEGELQALRRDAEKIYRKLVDQLQYYVALAAETPAKTANRAKQLKESGHDKQEIKQLRAEVALLQQQVRNGPTEPAALTTKRYITLPASSSWADTLASFMDQLAEVIPDEPVAKTIGAVYVLCGLPKAGKTTWATEHKSQVPGIALYIDGVVHTAEQRRFIADRLRKITNAPIHCVRVRADGPTCVTRSGRRHHGAAHIEAQHAIEMVAAEFEEVSLTEPFNSIVLA